MVSAERSEKADQRFGGRRPVRAYGKRPVAFPAADRFGAELDRGCARCARGRHGDRQAARSVALGEAIGNGAELAFLEKLHGARFAGCLDERRIAVVTAGFGIKRKAMMPVELDGGSGKKERAAEFGIRKPGLFDGFRRHEIGKMMGVDAGTPGA